MNRDGFYSLVLNPAPSTSSSSPSSVNCANLSIDERDELMKNLQKLFKAHQREQLDPTLISNSDNNDESSADGPGCSSSQLQLSANPHPHLTIAQDGNFSSLKSTFVDDKLLACFVIGGECRLCFPQLRALCFGELPTSMIDDAMKALAIMNAMANDEQLIVLKKAGIVQTSLSKCELITKTNAERLVSMLKSSGTPPLNEADRNGLHTLKVVHDCFGGCSALLYPNLVPAPCLECRTCHRMFKPEDFCRHTHKPALGQNVCFWGFDASNWPYYIRVDDEDGPPSTGQEAELQLANFVQNYPNIRL